VLLAQTQRHFIPKQNIQFTKYNNDSAVNNFTWPETIAVFLVDQCLTPLYKYPTQMNSLKVAPQPTISPNQSSRILVPTLAHYSQ